MFRPELLNSLKGYGLGRARADLASGLVVGLLALPLAMAFSIASGLPPERGIYAGAVVGFLVALLGGSRWQIAGPTGAFVVLSAGLVSSHGYEGLALATLLAGGLIFAMGFFGLGAVIKFIPYPVTTGFTSGIAVLLLNGQVPDFLGLRIEGKLAPDFLPRLNAWIWSLPSLNRAAALIGAGTVAMMALWPRRWRFPAALAALVIFAALVHFLGLPVETIQSRFGGLPAGLPPWSPVRFDFETLRAVFPAALTLAVIGSLESLLAAMVADGMTGSRHDSDQELMAVGLGNLAAPLLGGFCASGAIARTAANVKNGGRSPVSGIVHALTLLAIPLLAAPLASKIPLAALAGVLVMVAWQMSEWRAFLRLLRGGRGDAAVLAASFGLTVLIDLSVAVEVGMALSAFLFMRQMSETAQVKSLTREREGETERERDPGWERIKAPEGVEVLSLRGSFFFGAAYRLLDTYRQMEKPPRAVILDMKGVLHLDSTGSRALLDIARDCRARGARFLITGIHSQPFLELKESEALELIGVENLADDLASAFRLLEHA